jgi:signal transduction histidine kinase
MANGIASTGSAAAHEIRERAAVRIATRLLRRVLRADLCLVGHIDADGLAVPANDDPTFGVPAGPSLGMTPAFHFSPALSELARRGVVADADGVKLPSVVPITMGGRPKRLLVRRIADARGDAFVIAAWKDPARVPADAETMLDDVADELGDAVLSNRDETASADVSRHFEELMASLPQGLIFVDAKAQHAILGRSAATLLGCAPGEQAPAEVSARLRSLRSGALNAAALEAQFEKVALLPHVSTSARWDYPDRILEVSTYPILGNSQNGRIWVIENVTDAVMAQEALERQAGELRTLAETLQSSEEAARAAKDLAERANASKSAFLAGMSHELRTPLNAVIGFAEVIPLVLGEQGAAAKVAEYADDIRSAGRHLLSLINDILDLSKVEAGRRDFEARALDMQMIVEDGIIFVHSEARRRGVRLESAVAPMPSPHADERAMAQILLNLLSNAVKFTPAGGTVTTSVAMDGPDRWHLAVSDTGIGMSPEDVEVALTPYGQVRNDLTPANVGTGLGLPLCRALAERMGGSLSVESAPGRGTTVTATFPLGGPAEPA